MSYIVQLENKVWIAPWNGDPGRTVMKKNAEIFSSKKKAISALKDARIFRPFKKGEAVKV